MLKDLILTGVIATSIISANPIYPGANSESAQTKGGTLNYITVADTPLYNGEIADVKKTNDGLDILVTKLQENNSFSDSLIFHINNNTKLNIEKENIKLGAKVDVFYSGAVTRSIPGQATALAVNILKEEYIYEGQINETIDSEYGKMISVISYNKDAKFSEIMFNISNETTFEKGSFSDLKKGAKLKVVYGPVMTMSLPPHTTALNIEFVK